MNNFLLMHRRRCTAERLKFLYHDLLQAIDHSKEDVGRRGSVEDEWGRDDEDDNDENPKTQENEDEDNIDVVSLHGIQPSFANFEMLRPQSFRNSFRRRRRRHSPVKRISNRAGQDLAIAFRFLAATRVPEKLDDNVGVGSFLDEEYESSLAAAQRIENIVVGLIRDIGEVVANGEQQPARPSFCNANATIVSTSLVCDPCFEFFCEKNILARLVDIAKQNPNDEHHLKSTSYHHGVAWSPKVKAQVLQTISLLVSLGARKKHFLYYILSQNSINELLSCMLPLSQWTDPALEKLMPALVDLLKSLGLQLAGSPDLFPFFTLNEESFPLFHAALEVGTSPYAQTDSFVHITCLSLIINLMRTEDSDIHAWFATAEPEMKKLSNHFCQLFLNRYYRIADLSTGQIVDAIRSNSVGAQLVALHDQIQLLNDVFSCGISGLNVRMCELLMQRVISVVLQKIQPPVERAFIHVGVPDLDVIPRRESLAQVSFMFLAQLFHYVDYTPFVRMLAVVLFHPKTTQELVNYKSKEISEPGKGNDDYIFVPALDAIAQGKPVDNCDLVENPFRRTLLHCLRGDYGEWRFPLAAIVVECVIASDALDLETLHVLEIIPRITNHCDNSKAHDKEEKSPEDNTDVFTYKPTAFETTLIIFLEDRPHERLSGVFQQCLYCAGSLALTMLHKASMANVAASDNHGSMSTICYPDGGNQIPIQFALNRTKDFFCEKAFEFQNRLGLGDMFPELVETVVCDRYKKASTPASGRIQKASPPVFLCHLSQYGCLALISSPELLVRKFRSANISDLEEARFYIDMAIHFRSLCKVVNRFNDRLCAWECSHPGNTSCSLPLDLIDVADDFAHTFGAFDARPAPLVDLDLRGRMTFPCFPSTSAVSEDDRTEGATLQHSPILILVLDPTDLFVVKPGRLNVVDRGTIVCHVPLQKVIAAASDAHSLHVAVRHRDVGRLIKNGNMVLRFDNSGTCLVVRQYLERSRNSLRRELMERFNSLIR